MSLGGDKRLGPQLQRRILAFLAGEASTEVVAGDLGRRLEAQGATTDGTLVVHAQNVVVADTLEDRVAKELREVQDVMMKSYIESFKQSLGAWPDCPSTEAMEQRQALWHVFRAPLRVLGGRPDLRRLARHEPRGVAQILDPLCLQALSEPGILVEWGLWDQAPEGWERMTTTPRYAVGRRVLVRGKVSFKPSDPDFMCLGGGEEALRSWKGRS